MDYPSPDPFPLEPGAPPTIVIAGIRFYDISTLVTSNRYTRQKTDGLAIHHTVGNQLIGATLVQELSHIAAINEQHVAQGFGGFGYNAIGFASGRVYVVGDGSGARAHVASRNGELEGFAMAGAFTYLQNPVPAGLLLAGGRWLCAKYRQHGLKVTQGHSRWALSWSPTACPGDAGEQAILQMMRIATRLHRAV